MRLFFAVNFSEEVKRAVQDAIDRFPLTDPPWRWVRPSAFHITLKFLGEQPESLVEPLVSHAAAACGGLEAFSLRFGGLDGFPKLGGPRVLFFRIERGADELRRLAERLEAELDRSLGIPRENRPFRAHATIARIKTRLPKDIVAHLEKAPAPVGVSQRVEYIHLMRSELRRDGARYDVLKEIALTGSK